MTAALSPKKPPTLELVEDIGIDARELVRLEIELAKNDLCQALAGIKLSAILAAVAIALGLMGLASLVIALSLALGPLGALGLALVLVGAAGTCALIGYRRAPKNLMAATGLRLRDDQAILKGHLS